MIPVGSRVWLPAGRKVPLTWAYGDRAGYTALIYGLFRAVPGSPPESLSPAVMCAAFPHRSLPCIPVGSQFGSQEPNDPARKSGPPHALERCGGLR